MIDIFKLEVYTKIKLINTEIFELVRSNHKIDTFSKSQILRASTNIMFNIAEGCGRYYPRDKRKFMIMSRGSAYECISILDLFYTENYINLEVLGNLSSKYIEVIKMLYGLIKHLEKRGN